MLRKLLVLSSILFLLLFTSNVNAQTSTDKPTTANTSAPSAVSPKQQRLEKMELKQQMKDTIQMKREEMSTIVKTRREEFKAKIETLKDQRKKVLVERIDTKLSTVNAKHTDRFTEVLSKLQQLLDKVSAQATDAKVLADIKIVQAAIDTAKTAVETQAAKTYTATITDETTLRNNVGTTTSQLRQDLMATHKLVVAAKQAVQALRKDKMIMKKEATTSASL